MDALIPACDEFERCFKGDNCWQTAFASAVKKAEEGCDSTRNMEAKYVLKLI